MTKEEIEKEHEEYKNIVKSIEKILVSQNVTYQEHTERLKQLRKIYVGLTELRDIKVLQLESKEHDSHKASDEQVFVAPEIQEKPK